ncbi:MAG: PKD domain-containing protein [Haloarculaceae archaeon]
MFDDNHDVDEDTIDRNDFDVSPGKVNGVEAGELDGSETDADVEVSIEGAGNQAVTISSTNSTDIEDTNGNEFDPTGEFSEVVPEPDDPPQLHNVKWADASRVERYDSDIDWPDDKPGETTVLEAYITDGVGIRTDTIGADDFTVSRSRVVDTVAREDTSLQQNDDGENAFVLLVLSQNLDDGGLGDGGLTVGLSDDAEIRDKDGGPGTPGNMIERPAPDFTLYNTAPRLEGASRVNDTAVELTFVDDTDMAETSIQAHDVQLAGADLRDTEVSDFGEGNVDLASLQEYRIAGMNVTERGSNTSVVLRLPHEVDDDELLVRVPPKAEITDTIGNTFEPDDNDVKNRVLVDGMDGVPPAVEQFEVSGETPGPATLSIVPSERLAGIDVSVEGSASDSLDESDFTFDESEFTYEATYSPDDRGSLVFRLNSVTDDANNTRQVDMVAVRNGSGLQPRPDPVIALDFETSENRTFVFDGRHSSGPSPITNYTWEFGDGTSDRGLRATKQFNGGTHLVALTVTDSEGQSATDTATLDLTTGDVRNATADQLDGVRRVTPPDLQVVGSGDGSSGAARIEIRNPSPGMAIGTSERLQNGEPLAAGDDVSVDDVRVVPARYDDLSLAVSATGVEGVDDTAEVDGKPVGSFSVEHDAPDTAFESATLSTSVDAQRLDELNAAPEDVAVLRRNDGNWERLPTSSVSDADSSADGTARFRAETPGFSKFAVVAVESDGGEVAQSDDLEPGLSQQANAVVAENVSSGKSEEGDSQVHVRNATLAETTVSPGAVVLVNATIENRGDGNTHYTAGLSVNDTVVVTEPVTLPAGEERTVSFEYRANETGTVPVAVNGTSAGTLTVSGGGVLSSVFGPVIGLFGFLPLGLLRPIVLFVVAPVLVVFLILKGLALYLGY